MAGGIRSCCRCWERSYRHQKQRNKSTRLGPQQPVVMKRRVSEHLNDNQDMLQNIWSFNGQCWLRLSADCHARCECRLRAPVLILVVSAAPTAATPFTTLVHWLARVPIMQFKLAHVASSKIAGDGVVALCGMSCLPTPLILERVFGGHIPMNVEDSKSRAQKLPLLTCAPCP
jgi:hypothetical protein